MRLGLETGTLVSAPTQQAGFAEFTINAFKLENEAQIVPMVYRYNYATRRFYLNVILACLAY